ncbi:MAG: hypothetical protein ABIP79_07375 [Chitinophagaceae bacterium]
MTKALIISLILASTVTISLSCKKDSGNSGTSGGSTIVDCSIVPNKAFNADVNPIIQSRCNIPGCHAAGSTNGPGPLTNYTQVFDARSLIRTAVASGRMPQGSTLTAAQKNSIICWIDSGSPNN